jgi:hypothetical protein
VEVSIDGSRRHGTGPLFAAVENAIQNAANPLKVEIDPVRFELLGCEHDHTIAERYSRGGGLRVRASFVLGFAHFEVRLREGDNRAKYDVTRMNTFAIDCKPDIVNEDNEDGVRLHCIICKPGLCQFWRNPAVRDKNKWLPVTSGNESSLMPPTTLESVHLVLSFAAEDADDVRRLATSMRDKWDMAGMPQDVGADPTPLEIQTIADLPEGAEPNYADDGESRQLTAQTVDLDATVVDMQQASARIRSMGVHMRDDLHPALAPCVCLLERPATEGGGYRGNRCGQCQFRTACSTCSAECVHGAISCPHGMGSRVTVTEHALHEECEGDKELHRWMVWWMVSQPHHQTFSLCIIADQQIKPRGPQVDMGGYTREHAVEFDSEWHSPPDDMRE